MIYPHTNDKGELKCLLCNKYFKHLGSHIYHGHGFTAREYKEEYELPYNMPLISEAIKEKKQKRFEEDREKYLRNFKKGTEHQFKKGHTGQRRISQLERKRIIEQVHKMNERLPEKCPVCNTIYNHLDSHLITKHKLLRIK